MTLHPYRRSQHSNAGNCECGMDRESRVHPHPYTQARRSNTCVCAHPAGHPIHTDADTAQPEPADVCHPVEVDGEIIRVRGASEMTEEGLGYMTEIVRAAKRLHAAEQPHHTPPDTTKEHTVPNRIFTREQLTEWGVPNDMLGPLGAADFPGAAVELHCEQVETRRWVSLHDLVFKAPDDGKTYRVRYAQGLTEIQEDTDPWADEDTVTGVEVEQRTETVTRWKPVASRPATDHTPEQP